MWRHLVSKKLFIADQKKNSRRENSYFLTLEYQLLASKKYFWLSFTSKASKQFRGVYFPQAELAILNYGLIPSHPQKNQVGYATDL